MKITKRLLLKYSACIDGIDWFCNQKETDLIKLIEGAIKDKARLDWANWLIARVMTHDNQVKYAIYAAEQVIDIFEKKYPNDKRPRQAIDAAKKYLKEPTEENRNAAYASYAAASAYASYAAASANASYAAASANASAYDAYAADAYAYAMKIKILEYGLTLLGEVK